MNIAKIFHFGRKTTAKLGTVLHFHSLRSFSFESSLKFAQKMLEMPKVVAVHIYVHYYMIPLVGLGVLKYLQLSPVVLVLAYLCGLHGRFCSLNIQRPPVLLIMELECAVFREGQEDRGCV